LDEPATFESEALSILAFEFDVSDHAESERKLKRRLRDKKLGPFDATRLGHLRALKDDIRAELGKWQRSKFYKPSGRGSADPADWKFEALVRHFARRHPHVAAKAISGFLPYATYLYYLR
jgi:hypothetical protein